MRRTGVAKIDTVTDGVGKGLDAKVQSTAVVSR